MVVDGVQGQKRERENGARLWCFVFCCLFRTEEKNRPHLNPQIHKQLLFQYQGRKKGKKTHGELGALDYKNAQ